MTNTKKLLIAGALVAAVLIFLTNCKSPASQAQTAADSPITNSKDSIVHVDSIKTADQIVVDTVMVHTPLKLVITNLKSPSAPVIIGVYNEKCKFPDPKCQLKVYTIKPDSLSVTAVITDLPFGIYALAIYQDVNSNGKIDKNFMGIPTEPYAFSNNYKPTVKAPAFKNCRFVYCADTSLVAMKMIQ
jgi:uncharacterized protein (DUF2141 family)